jgi:hypothetical protein
MKAYLFHRIYLRLYRYFGLVLLKINILVSWAYMFDENILNILRFKTSVFGQNIQCFYVT